MTDSATPTGLDGLARAAGQAPGRGLPPVHLWNPARRDAIDIVIRRDGTWVHEGAVIAREALVRLFSTILRRDPDGYWLVTPVEMLKITVEDAPFVAVRVDVLSDGDGGALRFTTNVGDAVEAGPDHPLRVEIAADGEPRPYVHVRGGLEALISRPVFYELVEMAETRGDVLGISSHGAWFPLGRADEAAA